MKSGDAYGNDMSTPAGSLLSARDRCLKKRLGRAGFTLVELLVVIGIIGVLISILLPTIRKAQAQAREIQCMSNMRQWGMGIYMYADASKGYLPFDGDDGDAPGKPVGEWEDTSLWFNAIPPYVNGKPYSELMANSDPLTGAGLPGQGDNSIFVCPAASQAVRSISDAAGATTNGYFNVYGLSGGVQKRSMTFMCYVWNSKLNADENGDDLSRFKLVKVRPSTETVLMVEKRMRPLEHVINQDQSLVRLKIDRKRFTGRHREGGFLLFGDGHVGFATNTEVNTQGPVDYNQPGKLIWAPLGQAN